MIWKQPTESSPVPESIEPPAGSEPRRASATGLRPGRAVALLGLADSGKSSFLHSLGRRTARSRALRWMWPFPGREHAANIGRPSEPLEATARGTFRVIGWGALRRPWISVSETEAGIDVPASPIMRMVSLAFCPGRSFCIPEISGENVELFAEGLEPTAASDVEVNALLSDYLRNCDELIFLAGLKSSKRDRALSPDSVESAMSRAVRCIANVVEHMNDGAAGRKGRPVFVSFLVTKRDALKGRTGLDRVNLPAAKSTLAGLLTDDRRDWLSGLVKREGSDVSFSLNEVCDHKESASDLDLQEAAAVDFLRCHAPKAASDLAALSARPGVSLRTFTCNPFGFECKTAAGASAYPSDDRLDPSMCWEPLDDLVERRFRWRARQRLRDSGIVAAAALALALLAGPLLSWACHSRAVSDSGSGRPEAARGWLRADDFNPWSVAIRAVSDRQRYADALRWSTVRDRAVQGGMGEDSAFIEELDSQVARRDPSGTLASPALRRRQMDRLLAMLDPTADDAALARPLQQAGTIVLQPSEALRFGASVASIRASDQPAVLQRSGRDWRIISERLSALGDAVRGASRDGLRIVVAGENKASADRLLGELELGARSAAVRALLPDDPPPPTDPAELRDLLARAIRADDAQSIRRIDGLVAAGVLARWREIVPAEDLAAPRVPSFAKALAGTSEWDLIESLRQRIAAEDLERWLKSLRDYLAVPHDPAEVVAFAARASAEASSISAQEPVFAGIDMKRLVEPLNRLARDAAVVDALENAPRERSALAETLRGETAEAARALLGSVVDAGQDAVLPLSVVHADLVDRARRRLLETIEAAVADPSFPSPESVGEAKLALEFLGGSSDAKSRDTIAVADALLSASPDPGRFSALVRSAVVADGVIVLPVLRASGRSPSAHVLVPAAVAGIGSAAGVPDSTRRHLLESLLSATGDAPAGWSEFDPADIASLRDALHACRRSGVAVDATDVSARAIGDLVRRAGPFAQDPQEFGRFVQQVGLWDLIGRDCGDPVDPTIGLRIHARLLGDLEADLRAQGGAGTAEMLLAGLSQRTDFPDAGLRGLAEALRAHRRLISQWRLVPLYREDEIACFVSPREWSTEEISQLPRVSEVPKDVGIDVAGALTDPAAAAKGMQSWLGIRSRDGARWLVSRAGLRLPTRAEWSLARAGVRSQAAGSRPADAQRWKFEELRAAGDVAFEGTDREVVGLVSGVREWCDDEPERPLGGSSVIPESAAAAMSPSDDKRRDVGVRPALDAVPATVRKLLPGTVGSRRE